MSDSVPSLIEGYEPRDYLRFDFHILEVFRDLAEDIEWASPSVIRTAVFLTSLFHYRTQGYLRYLVREPEAIFREVSAIWEGRGNTWLALSLRDLNEALHGVSGKNTVAKGVDFLHEIGLVEKSVPEDFATNNNAARYRFNGYRARELFVETTQQSRDAGTAAERSAPAPTPNEGEAIPETGKAIPNEGKAIPGPEGAIPQPGQALPETGKAHPDQGKGSPPEGKDLGLPRARAMPFRDQTLSPLDPPLYRERNETKEKRRALSRELCRLLAAELDRRLPGGQRNPEGWLEEAELLVDAFPGRFDYLAEMLIWTQEHDWWQDKVTNMRSFYRNLDTIRAQYDKDLSQQEAKVYKIDERR